MVTVVIVRADGRKVRVTAKDIRTAAKLVGGKVSYPIDGEEFFRGNGPPGFLTIDEVPE